jgi:hypothetical protein
LVVTSVPIIGLAWLVAAHHCALAAIQKSGRLEAEHASCHSQEQDSEPLGHHDSCCKALAAPLPHLLVAPTIQLKELKLAWLSAVRIEAPVEANFSPGGYTAHTGPPRNSLSFALLVLNRSLFSHAPPRPIA